MCCPLTLIGQMFGERIGTYGDLYSTNGQHLTAERLMFRE